MTKEVQTELERRESETEALEQTLMHASHASSVAEEASNDAEDAIEEAEEMRQMKIAKDGFELRAQRDKAASRSVLSESNESDGA